MYQIAKFEPQNFLRRFSPSTSRSLIMSRVAAPFLTRVTARTLSTATGSAQKVDQAALDAAARSAGMKIEKFTATQAITYVR